MCIGETDDGCLRFSSVAYLMVVRLALRPLPVVGQRMVPDTADDRPVAQQDHDHAHNEQGQQSHRRIEHQEDHVGGLDVTLTLVQLNVLLLLMVLGVMRLLLVMMVQRSAVSTWFVLLALMGHDVLCVV